MNGREMKDSSRCGRDGQRSWPRFAAAPVAFVLISLLATACGGGSSPASSAAGGSTAAGKSSAATGGSSSSGGATTRAQGALAYAGCMRSHGVPSFPDPDSGGNFNLSNDPVSSQETTANQACNRLLNVGTQLSAAQTQHTLGQLLKYSQCMRAHGVPNFPDPQLTTGGIGEPGGFTFDTVNLNLNQKSPQYQSAAQACQSIATHAKGG
jgi:hypothetical protein